MYIVKEEFPIKELSILSVVLISSSISLSGLFPYIALMVVDLDMSPNINQAGYYAGYLAASMMIGRLFSSIPFGLLADRVGRKPVLLIGCMSITICSLIFGVSTNFWMAILSRFILGVFNPIVGISKTVVSEVCSKKHESTGIYTLFHIFPAL